MKLGFVGVGVVGGAIKQAFDSLYETYAYDKFKSVGNLEDVLKTDVIFISVPTATKDDGSQNLSPLIETCQILFNNKYEGIIVIKCTVLPGTCQHLSKQFNLRIVHSPEFLTAANPYKDFINQKSVILGGNKSDTDVVQSIFSKLNHNTPVNVFNNATYTEMIKYTHNLFLASKVSFFNEIFDVCSYLGISYEYMMDGVHSIGQVGKGHTQVPGPDGQLGFGGMCFPKDTKAFLTFCRENKIDVPILEATVSGNNNRR
jgi:UDPglucose 6-dehydrogenase